MSEHPIESIPFLALLLLFLVLTGASSGAASAGNLPDLRDIQRETRTIERFVGEVKDVHRRALARAEALETQLAEEELHLRAVAVDPEMLRAARLDLDSMQSRVAVLEGRIEHRSLALTRLGTLIGRLQEDIVTSDRLDTERLRSEAGLELLLAKQAATASIVEAIRDLLGATRRQKELLIQRLRLLQSRLSLATLDGAAANVDDKRVAMLQLVIGDFLARAVRNDRAAEAVAGTGPRDTRRRRAIAMRADDAVTRGFLRQNDLELVLVENRLDGLAALREDTTMPLHVLEVAQRKLDNIEGTLDRVDASLGIQLGILGSKLAALERGGISEGSEVDMTRDLRSLIDFQGADIGALRQRIAEERTTYDRVIGEARAASLLEHRSMPAHVSDWRRIGASALHLPSLVADSLVLVVRDIPGRAAEASPGRRALTWLGVPVVGLLVLWGSRRLRAAARVPEANANLAATFDAASRALPAAIPAALWLFVALSFGIPRQPLIPVLALLSLWPLIVFVSRLSRLALLGRLADAERVSAREALRVRAFHRLRLGLWVAGALGLIYLLTHALPMAPLLADLLDRLAMLGLIAMVFPALALRNLISQTPAHMPSSRSRALRFLAPLSRILPVFVVVTGLIGLVGLTNLAWELTGYFLWLLLVGLALYFAAGVLADLKARLLARLTASDPDRTAFWRSHFLEPGHRLALFGAFAGGGAMLFALWGWNAQTPAVLWARGLVDTVLFRVGEAPFTIGDIVMVLVLLGAVFWVGGWSQQVSYQIAYRKVRDQGLRQALATFTQYVVIVAGVLLALRIIGFDLTTLTVFAASLGVGIGFGMQNIVNNFISGVLLLAERPLRIGDYVSIGLHQGTVTQIGIRSLTVRTPDKQEVVIPNGSVISKEFTNWTRTDDTVRDVQYLTIPYESDRNQAIEIVRQILSEQPNVLKDPAPGVFLDGYTEYGVKIRVQYCFRFVRGPGTLVTRSAVLLEIGRRFAEAGIEFAEWGPLPALGPAQ